MRRIQALSLTGVAMKTLKSVTGALSLVTLLLAGCVIICPAPNREQIAFTTIDRTNYSLVQVAKNVVVKDAASWTLLWKAHSGSDANVPAVDFSQKMVVAVFRGTLPNGCYSTMITQVYRATSAITVHRVDTEPGPDAICTLAIVTPAHLIAIPRSDEQVAFTAERRTVP
jgi:hypothetical protein